MTNRSNYRYISRIFRAFDCESRFSNIIYHANEKRKCKIDWKGFDSRKIVENPVGRVCLKI